jgi:ATP adenylyltransferase
MQRRNDEGELFAPGTLLAKIRAVSKSALDCGALQPIQTRSTYVEDGGVRFLVRTISSLRDKPPQDDARNPFLPYESPLYVARASADHVCILNKYKVADLHLLIVTREFEHQQCALNRADFHALWRCLSEYDSLGFYNSGPASGASQIHKHLQTVPLPLARGRGQLATPLEPLLEVPNPRPGVLAEAPRLPFAHCVVYWDPAELGDLDRLAEMSLACYEAMLRRHHLGPPAGPDQRMERSYNLLVTRRWMLLVPRSRECFHGISFNSLAFAGALLVQDREQLDQLRTHRPFAALQAVADPRAAAPG